MVIGKADVVNNFDSEQSALMIAFEAAIDKCLKARYDGQPVWVNIPPGLHRRSIDKIMRDYEKAGWKVKEMDDQRDGHALSFG